MNLYELAPDNDGAGEMEKGKVIGSLFLKADQQFAEAVEKRVNDLHNPAANSEVGIVFQLLLFLTTGSNVWNIIALFNLFSAASIACIQA